MAIAQLASCHDNVSLKSGYLCCRSCRSVGSVCPQDLIPTDSNTALIIVIKSPSNVRVSSHAPWIGDALH